MAACLVYFNEEVFQPEVRSFNALEKYDKSNLGNIEWLEWEELKVRYLFEQEKYEACVTECNRWLDEYPMSLVMLTMRSYADYRNCAPLKKYLDIRHLISIYPKRAELRLMAAQYQWSHGNRKNMETILEPVKNKCLIQYEFARIMNDGNNAYGDPRKKEWYELLKKIKKQEVQIPFFSKYGMIDLKRIYSRTAISMYTRRDETIYTRLLKLLRELIEDMPECPKKDETLSLFYCDTGQSRNMIETSLKAIETVTSKLTLIWYYGLLLNAYAKMGEFDQMDEIGEKLCAIDEEGYKKVFEEYVEYLNGTDEARFMKLEELCERYVKSMTDLRCVRTVAQFYEKLGILTNDVSKFKKGIAIVEQFPKTFGYVGEEGEDANIYMWLGRLYARCGMKEEALDAIDRMYRYANHPDIPIRNLGHTAEIYEFLEMFDKAKESYLKAMEHGVFVTPRILRMYLKSGDYQKAREFFEDGDAMDNIYALHTLYLEKGCYDRKDLLDAKERLESAIRMCKENKNGIDELGDIYLMMTDLLYSLGEEKLFWQYRKKAEEFQWNSLEGKNAYFLRTDLWILWYQKRYREALELLDNNRSALTIQHIEVDMFDYRLRKLNLMS